MKRYHIEWLILAVYLVSSLFLLYFVVAALSEMEPICCPCNEDSEISDTGNRNPEHLR